MVLLLTNSKTALTLKATLVIQAIDQSERVTVPHVKSVCHVFPGALTCMSVNTRTSHLDTKCHGHYTRSVRNRSLIVCNTVDEI